MTALLADAASGTLSLDFWVADSLTQTPWPVSLRRGQVIISSPPCQCGDCHSLTEKVLSHPAWTWENSNTSDEPERTRLHQGFPHQVNSHFSKCQNLLSRQLQRIDARGHRDEGKGRSLGIAIGRIGYTLEVRWYSDKIGGFRVGFGNCVCCQGRWGRPFVGLGLMAGLKFRLQVWL